MFEANLPPLPRREMMGLKHPENIFSGRFNEWAQAVLDLDMRILPGEMEFPSRNVTTYEQMQFDGKKIRKAVGEETKLVLGQFRKGAQGFPELTEKNRSTFGALAAMVFPENPNLAFELATEMRLEGGVSKPVDIDTRVNVREEELVFQKMPVVSGENCLLAAGLRLMAERRYKDKGNQTVSTVAQLINWDRKENDFEDSLSDNAIAWLNYGSLNQDLSGGASGIGISLDADKNWHLLSRETINSEKFTCPPEWNYDKESGYWISKDKGMFKVEGNQLITQGVSPEDFIEIARAARPAEEEIPDLLKVILDQQKKVKPPELPTPRPAEEEIPDWFRRLQEESVAAPAEPEKPAEEINLPSLPYGPELGPRGDEEPVQTADIIVDKARSLKEGKYCVTVRNLVRIGNFENLQKELREAIGDKKAQVSELVIEDRARNVEMLDFLLAAKDWDDFNLRFLVDQAKSYKDNLSFTKEQTREELLGWYRRNVEISNAFYGRYDLPDKIGDGLWKEIETQVWPEEKKSEQSRIRLY